MFGATSLTTNTALLPTPAGSGVSSEGGGFLDFITGSLLPSLTSLGTEYLKLQQAKSTAEAQMKAAKSGMILQGAGGTIPYSTGINSSDLMKYVLIGGLGIAAVLLLTKGKSSPSVRTVYRTAPKTVRKK
ncbi:MAG: hypothetical protein ABIG95_02445 [Candidatus Woesearchaeota archaeon]